MNLRIKELRKKLSLTQQQFADKLGLKRNTIAMYEMDRDRRTVPSDQAVHNICREFNVSEKWLRTGEGEMFIPLTDGSDFENMWLDIRIDESENAAFIKKIMKAYWGLSSEKKDAVREFIDSIVEQKVAEE